MLPNNISILLVCKIEYKVVAFSIGAYPKNKGVILTGAEQLPVFYLVRI